MKLVNLTPHSVRILLDENRMVEIPSSGVARVESTGYLDGSLTLAEGSVPVWHNVYGDVSGLPDPVEGVTYIVSGMVLAALQGRREDVVAPDTGPSAIREDGQIVAVKGFIR